MIREMFQANASRRYIYIQWQIIYNLLFIICWLLSTDFDLMSLNGSRRLRTNLYLHVKHVICINLNAYYIKWN
jgi:hypothetical protein